MRHLSIYLLELLICTLPGAVFWLLTLPVRSWRQEGIAEQEWYREGVWLLLCLYLSGLLALTLAPYGFWDDVLIYHRMPTIPPRFSGGVNLRPFVVTWQQFRYYARAGRWDVILINYPGNVLMFLPFGLLCSLLLARPKGWKVMFLSSFLSITIELSQLLFSRGTDIDDVILNTLGGLLGYGCYLLLR